MSQRWKFLSSSLIDGSTFNLGNKTWLQETVTDQIDQGPPTSCIIQLPTQEKAFTDQLLQVMKSSWLPTQISINVPTAPIFGEASWEFL